MRQLQGNSTESDPIRWLYGLERFGIKLGLDGMRFMLEALGRPDAGYPCMLVGGTNGKGSVAASIDAILSAAGIRAGLYTSPHLVRPGERVRIAGADISDSELGGYLAEARDVIASGLRDGSLAAHPSFFETMTAAALVAFRKERVQAAILEVGLGGRLDATNAVDAVASVVVTVDLDHTDRLGTTIEQIAREKAGIVKPGRPLVSGVRQPEAVEILRGACAAAGARFIEVLDASSRVDHPDGSFTIETARERYPEIRPSLPGRHQAENARTAIVALEEFSRESGLRVSPEAVRSGLTRVRWPGRLQWISGDPPILLDGAHNPAGAEALAAYLRSRRGPRPVLLFSAVKNKDVAAIARPLQSLVAAVVVTRSRVDRAADPAELVSRLSGILPRCEEVADPARALARAREIAGKRGCVLVAGSLYLVGEVLAMLEGDVGAPGPISL